MAKSPSIIDAVAGLENLISGLRDEGYRVVGPALGEGAIIYDEIESADQLPVGWTAAQGPGTYRLTRRDDETFFGYALGPQSFKKYLHVPTQELWRVTRDGSELTVEATPAEQPRYAFLGIRACEIAAIAIQDRVLMGDAHKDAHYAGRRQDNFVVAVNCAEAGETCFCVSMDTGPKAQEDFDLSLTELIDADQHVFLVEVGSDKGAAMLDRLNTHPATESEIMWAETVVEGTARRMGRQMEATEVPALLMRNLEHPRWDEVAERCLSCGNCTQVCPTCFCTDTRDETDLTGSQAVRTRHWDSCFTVDFSYLHGGSVRKSTKSRYRQWMTHKLASWVDQFGSSGCVGCGRCITWCPVGIDITEEVNAIRESEGDG